MASRADERVLDLVLAALAAHPGATAFEVSLELPAAPVAGLNLELLPREPAPRGAGDALRLLRLLERRHQVRQEPAVGGARWYKS